MMEMSCGMEMAVSSGEEEMVSVVPIAFSAGRESVTGPPPVSENEVAMDCSSGIEMLFINGFASTLCATAAPAERSHTRDKRSASKQLVDMIYF